jgi:putative ATP-dependent endonuclease of the OLD family
MNDLQIRIRNYKCFDDAVIFNSLKKLNLIIGRNNSGKSSLVDIVEAISGNNYEFDQATWRSGKQPEILFKSHMPEALLKQIFPSSRSGGFAHAYASFWEYGKVLINREIEWLKSGKNANTVKFISCDEKGMVPPLSSVHELAKQVAEGMSIPIQGRIFKRLGSERDIKVEPSDLSNLAIHSDGRGITNVIQRYLTAAALPGDLVEVDILSALNKIFVGDAYFSSITTQQHPNGHWEIFLQENEKGKIALSKSGSGLKTVIAILTFLILIPHIERKKPEKYLFAFEEIENNIHPALLRRLGWFLYEFFRAQDNMLFLTTHSNVLIDLFSKQNDAQIIHVTHQAGISTCRTATTYFDNHGILDDLDVRASDILQSNGIIWVEGPSDRIYLKTWIDLWSDGKLKEGYHYQILYYGGRLLSHLSAEEPDLVENTVSILQANRNAMILIDSDKKNNDTAINSTKQRLLNEFTKMNSYVWITGGKEIENYLSAEVIAASFGKPVDTDVAAFESFFEYLETISPGMGRKHEKKKYLLAELLIPKMTRQNCEKRLDLDIHMTRVCEEIRKWNN